VVAILHDITEFRKLEKIKRDFVLSASHELRTPLTAIKGYVETLQTKISKKDQQYLNVIKRHTERLINIVSDLLNLSELEEKVNKPEFELVNIKNLIENIKTLFAPRFKEKNLALKVNVEEKLPLISGDSFKLEQMLINLVDNAIKYTEKGEVEIAARRLNQSIRITIKDTGIGIAQEHLSRIFERFYVVDKSHSRRMGGTGLGLSIVKHIVLLHNGEIEVESTPGVGTKFIITLPLSQGK
jgi:two-component system phosphate regulon sensor histidine kinase PhoR